LKDAVRWGRLARNPADAADPPRGGPKSDGVHSWDAATLRQFLAVSMATSDRLHPLWVLLATTGMRRGEALGLRWSDVDLDAGLRRLTLKGLRHTWATLALERGIHPRVVQERLGHSTIAITLGIYSHVSPTLHDEAANLVAALVLGD